MLVNTLQSMVTMTTAANASHFRAIVVQLFGMRVTYIKGETEPLEIEMRQIKTLKWVSTPYFFFPFFFTWTVWFNLIWVSLVRRMCASQRRSCEKRIFFRDNFSVVVPCWQRNKNSLRKPRAKWWFQVAKLHSESTTVTLVAVFEVSVHGHLHH